MDVLEWIGAVTVTVGALFGGLIVLTSVRSFNR